MKGRRTGYLIAALLVAGKLLIPFQSRNIADLIPVETLLVTVEQGEVRLDGKDCHGRGSTWADAVQDLGQSAAGTVFLGMVDRIVLCGQTHDILSQAISDRQLRPAAEVCVCADEITDVEQLSSFLAAHRTGLTLQRIRARALRGEPVAFPLLIQTEGGLRLYAP